ncbi:type II toxin-antitoxin system PemK/MazF family toxin [Lactococcus garvieae]|uniref:type II toxin-antitoxin system PemK/MazF family toxin n=1 Tax=Lactococcus garvieae TaxID=1363 RepID=UPI00385366F5
MVSTPMQGDIIKINLDSKQGHEQHGYRPYLCLSHEKVSSTSNVAVFAPISNTVRIYPFYYSLMKTRSQTTGQILLDQLVTVDYNARHFKFVEKLSKEEMRPILAITKLVFDENKV